MGKILLIHALIYASSWYAAAADLLEVCANFSSPASYSCMTTPVTERTLRCRYVVLCDSASTRAPWPPQRVK
ncbi:hypothetical protein C8T65DRAFT_273328 [Cerioporus squamosus]|nr:hypothetical protein C8T65DRAFT_273328 [Cerioporus squamosus]